MDEKGQRIAKVIARAGVCSRREAERYIEQGRVSVNGEKLSSAACVVTSKDVIVVDNKPLPVLEQTRVWRYHKPQGLVTSHKDPEGRKTVFEALPSSLPRVISIGRLDLNSEGLLLLTNDGEFARQMELPSTGWLRRYRVRIHGEMTDNILNKLEKGVEVDGVQYKEVQVKVDKKQGSNTWLTVGLKEGKNREIRRLMEFFGFKVTRLIRTSYGPFQLGTLQKGEVEEIRGKILQDQVGAKISVSVEKAQHRKKQRKK